MLPGIAGRKIEDPTSNGCWHAGILFKESMAEDRDQQSFQMGLARMRNAETKPSDGILEREFVRVRSTFPD
jgi:hypothetical protein